MDFASIVLFLSMYYLRPQEWAGAFNKLHPMWITMAMAVFSLVNRERGFRLGTILRTPHDWMMMAYCGWIIFSSGAPWDTFKEIMNVMLFYVVIVQTLTDIPRIRRFLAWWALMIMVIVLLALGSEFGFDPLGSYDLTHGMEKGRLSLNLSIFDNPNGLAHSVVPVLPMLFFLLFWKRIFMKAGILAMALPLWCIFLTQSKGAFLCGFVTILMTLTFGRPKAVQVLILLLSVGFGYAALYSLPRMDELKKARTEGGIQGRLAAYKFGLDCLHNHPTGVGYKRFTTEFFTHGPLRPKDQKRRPGRPAVMEHYHKSSHGSYNENGAELGWTGLYLFIGVLYCCFRTVMTAKSADVEEERVRRILFVLVVSYAVSSWMVDFAYRTTFFMFAAAISAFHQRLWRPEAEKSDEERVPSVPYPMPAPAFMVGPSVATVRSLAALHPTPQFSSGPQLTASSALSETDTSGQQSPGGTPVGFAIEDEAPPPPPVMKWKRLGLVDLVAIYAITWGVVRYWAYIITSL